MEDNRVSLLSVAAALWHRWLSLATLTHIGWVAYISWVYSTYGNYGNIHYAIVASAKDSAGLLPQNIAFAVVVVAIADFIAKGGIMNTAEYVQKKFFEPSLRRQREKIGAEKLAEGLAKGRAEALAELGMDESAFAEAKMRAKERANALAASEREEEYAKIRAETRADTLAEALRIALSGAGAETASDALSEALETHAKWANWNARRMEAEAQGIPFNEPPPSLDDQRRAV